MNKFLMAAAIVVIGSACYAKSPQLTRRSDEPSAARTMAYPGIMEKMGWRFDGKNKAIMETRKKLFELKKFKWETMRQNLKIDNKEFANILNKKMNDLKLSNKTFDSLRKSAKTNMERMHINKLENKFLRFQMMLKFVAEGCPVLEEKIRQMKTSVVTEE